MEEGAVSGSGLIANPNEYGSQRDRPAKADAVRCRVPNWSSRTESAQPFTQIRGKTTGMRLADFQPFDPTTGRQA